MAVFLFITNTKTDEVGLLAPNIPAGTPFVGNLYEKQGNVSKYLIKTPVDLTGLPGVFGPIDRHDLIQAVLDFDNARTFRGWIVDDVPDWAIDGEHLTEADSYRKIQVSMLRFDLVGDDRTAQVSWVELEIPEAPQ